MSRCGGVCGQEVRGSCPLLRCWIWHFLLVQDFSARSQRRRKKRAYVGPHFYLFLRCADAGLWHAPGGLFNGSRGVQSPRINSSFYEQSLSFSLQLSPSPPFLLSASLGRSLNVITFLGVQAPLVVHSSVLFANYSLWPSPLAPPPVLTYSTRRLTRIKEYLKVADPLF